MKDMKETVVAYYNVVSHFLLERTEEDKNINCVFIANTRDDNRSRHLPNAKQVSI
jgi:hypothetical protein